MADSLLHKAVDSALYRAPPTCSTRSRPRHLDLSPPLPSICPSANSETVSSLPSPCGTPASSRSSISSLTPSIELPRFPPLPRCRSHPASTLRATAPLSHRRTSSAPASSSNSSGTATNATRVRERTSTAPSDSAPRNREGDVATRPSASHYEGYGTPLSRVAENVLETADASVMPDAVVSAGSVEVEGTTLIRAVSGEVVAEYEKKWTAERIRVDLAWRWKSLCPFVVLIDLSQSGSEIHDSTQMLPDEAVGVLLNKTDLSFHEWTNVIHRHAKYQDKAGVQRAVAALRSASEQRDAPIGEAPRVCDVMRHCLRDALAHKDDVIPCFGPSEVQTNDDRHALFPQVEADDVQETTAQRVMVERECYMDLLCESMGEEVLTMVTHVERQEPLLFEACAEGDVVLVASLLKHSTRYQDVNLNIKSGAGHSPLILATLANSGSTVRLLIDAKADVNMKGQFGRSSLLIAAHRGYRDIVKILTTEFGSLVDINIEDRHAQTPLLAAAFHGFEGIVADMIEAGAQIRGDNHGNDPCMLAKQRGHWSIVSLFERTSPLQCPNEMYSIG
eukprot:GEMP01027181.1.p1 GENE.GEMP01027181.1~~GEMP01027181.1.p1  ORF type:complete len:562 (+),score=132.29 GEMP01027181.1:141-1826(+)